MTVDPDDGVRKIWSEDHVSEDFQIAVQLQIKVSCCCPGSKTDRMLTCILGLRRAVGIIHWRRIRGRRLAYV